MALMGYRYFNSRKFMPAGLVAAMRWVLGSERGAGGWVESGGRGGPKERGFIAGVSGKSEWGGWSTPVK